MNIINIINKKKNNKYLSKEEICYAVNGYLDGSVKDYQMSSLLMAICINGMNEEEIFTLTDIMLNSGDKINLDFIDGIKVDKHSTGGIGDKTTIILAPLVASTGVPVSKMSGRGLGITGGTIDKLESIENFNVYISEEDYKKQAKEIGVVISAQTGNLVPADKKIYALRDVSGTTESIPLIAASIMSKKLASGADKFVLDVKVGSGALMKDIDTARELANIMIKIGKNYNKEVVCVLSNMNEPLGCNIGNGLEVLEAIDILNNKGDNNLRKIVLELGSIMVSLAKNITIEEANNMLSMNIENKKGYNKLLELVKYQNGDINNIKVSSIKKEIYATKTGYVDLDANLVGTFVHELGAGRNSKEEKIDYGVGLILNKKTGDVVKKGDLLATVYYNEEKMPSFDKLDNIIKIENETVNKEKLILEIIK